MAASIRFWTSSGIRMPNSMRLTSATGIESLPYSRFEIDALFENGQLQHALIGERTSTESRRLSCPPWSQGRRWPFVLGHQPGWE